MDSLWSLNTVKIGHNFIFQKKFCSLKRSDKPAVMSLQPTVKFAAAPVAFHSNQMENTRRGDGCRIWANLYRTAGSEGKFLSSRRQLVSHLSPPRRRQLVATALAVFLHLCQMCIFFFEKNCWFSAVVAWDLVFHDLTGSWWRPFEHTRSRFSSSPFLLAATSVFAPGKLERKKSPRLLLQNRLAVRCGLILTSAGLCRLVIPRKCVAAVWGCGFAVRVCVHVCVHAPTYRRRPGQSSHIRVAHSWDLCTLAPCEKGDRED